VHTIQPDADASSPQIPFKTNRAKVTTIEPHADVSSVVKTVKPIYVVFNQEKPPECKVHSFVFPTRINA
jgi:hypothetical protein